MRNKRTYLLICGLAAMVPFVHFEKKANAHTEVSPNWPMQINGQPLNVLPLTKKEKVFNQGFPGETKRFTDGKREIIIRWTTHPTRKLHPSMDCFKANGYSIKPLPMYFDDNENKWSQFKASKDGQHLTVSERIYDSGNKSWADVSAWYWSASLNNSNGPWYAVTIAQATQKGEIK